MGTLPGGGELVGGREKGKRLRAALRRMHEEGNSEGSGAAGGAGEGWGVIRLILVTDVRMQGARRGWERPEARAAWRPVH